MKTSLRRLRGFALHKHHNDGAKFRTNNLPRPLAQLDELAQATQDMEDMRDCYDTLLSAAAATANSAYEFSESLREMGACLLEKTALNDDEDSGKVLLMLGKLQFELQKLVDNYRSHIFQTITTPSESLLNELRIVEEMKQQCDEKRKEYEKKIAERSRSGKGGTISSQELQVAHDEYEVEATLFIFRLKSLKQGQSRSLLTQAARHHASQLSFFRKSLKALEAVEPHVKLVTEQQHIDYQFSGLEDDDNESDNEGDDDSYDAYDDGELSFDYGQNEQGQEVDATVTNSMEVDQVGLTFPQLTSVEVAKENLDKIRGDAFLLSGEFRAGSQSAPLLAMKKVDPNETLMRMRTSSTRKLHTYVLPTPNDTKNSVYSGSGYPGPHTRDTNNSWHSTPLEQKKTEAFLGNERFSGPNLPKAESVLKDSNKNSASIRLPPPLPDLHSNSDAKKIKRQAFSGPLTSKAWSSKPLSTSGPLVPEFKPQLFSGPLIRTPVPLPPASSPPKISELHELPRPPTGLPSKYATRDSGLVGHSAPLVSRGGQEVLHAANRRRVSIAASPLPTPPQSVTRSFSTPSSSPRVNNMFASKNSRAFQRSILAEDVGSPPLTPISLPNASTTQTSTQETQNQGTD